MPENIIGPQIRRLRYGKGLTQNQLAAKCSVLGFDVSRSTLAKIEAQVRCVNDSEITCLARALGVQVAELFRKPEQRKRR